MSSSIDFRSVLSFPGLSLRGAAVVHRLWYGPPCWVTYIRSMPFVGRACAFQCLFGSLYCTCACTCANCQPMENTETTANGILGLSGWYLRLISTDSPQETSEGTIHLFIIWRMKTLRCHWSRNHHMIKNNSRIVGKTAVLLTIRLSPPIRCVRIMCTQCIGGPNTLYVHIYMLIN